jgi:hypothetical protein
MPPLSSLVYCLQARLGAYPRVEHRNGASFVFTPFLPPNILGWKGLPVTNTLAYYEN